MSERRQRGVRVGCVGLAGATRAELFEAVDVIEEHALLREPRPGPRALRRWRREAPERGGFTLVSPPELFDGDDESLEAVSSAVDALAPEALVVRPGVSAAPSQTGRDRLRQLAQTELGVPLIFWPTGLWEPETTAALADELDISVVIDPLSNDPQGRQQPLWERELERGVAYLHLDRVAGARRRFDDFELDELAELVGVLERGWVIFANALGARDAHALAQRLSG